jgi:ankyrin repeat protein
MPDRSIPTRPNIEQYRKQAKELLRAVRAGEWEALARMHKNHPRISEFASEDVQAQKLVLADAQVVLAREHGFASWPAFTLELERLQIMGAVASSNDPINTFIEAACADRRGWHGGGTLENAETILVKFPDVAAANIYSAAVLGDENAVRDWLTRDRQLATAKGGPHGWDALTYLCFSRYLRIDKTRADSFAACARSLLECGASANTGWMETIDTPPRQIIESAIYGAAGVARSAAVTQVLLDFGADPNDEETPYHVAETYDNEVLNILLRSDRFNERSLATVAARKCDWHDDAGLLLALEHGANPNFMTVWKHTPLHQSIRRDNGQVMIEQLLDHGADPLLANAFDGLNAFQMAAYHGRGDILDAFDQRGFKYEFPGIDALVASCARGDIETARHLLEGSPDLRALLLTMGGTLLARFSGAGNDLSVRALLAVGISPNALWPTGEGYWDLAPASTALHVAAWRANHDVVNTLIAAGTDVNARDAHDRTALQLAVKACTDSYWKYRRKPESVAALLAAGATTDGIDLPTGYDDIDRLLIS